MEEWIIILLIMIGMGVAPVLFLFFLSKKLDKSKGTKSQVLGWDDNSTVSDWGTKVDYLSKDSIADELP